ncbi:MAG TPA: YceI family protein [Thermoanaerobaculia bacterium]|jgi:polyisoprenoid-binding protein YceI|nr:YceI family protein [Thermoanaerobaculia bacterium]
MKSSSLFLALSLVVLLPACKSEIDQKPAAEVTETTATTVTETTSTEAPAGATRVNVIKEKSKIEFVGAKVTRDHDGGFKNFDGWLEYAGGKPSQLSFDIDLDSVFTDTEKLTGHLKSADFFDVAKFPKSTFTSSSVTDAPAGTENGATHIVKGTLDLHGVTKEVTIPVKAEVTADGVRTTSEFTINRHDWGISYKGAADDLIKDNVLIKLDLMFPAP